MTATPVGVDEVNSLAWTAVAHAARIHHRALTMVGDPRPGSNFAQLGELYPFEWVSDRARAYLMAGLEHMLMWADLSAPLKVHEEQVMTVSLRPAFTLARATIEASAQAVWLMDTQNPVECIQRHLSLIRWDLHEHRRSKLSQRDKDAIKAREDELLDRVSGVFEPDEIRPPNGYLDVIRSACAAEDLGLEPDVVERLWRAASGAAHGKFWPTLEFQRVEVGEEYQPGRYRTLQIPDATAITEVLEAANAMSQYGVARFVAYSGADVAVTLGEASAWVAERIPLVAGTSRDELLRMPHALTWPSDAGEDE